MKNFIYKHFPAYKILLLIIIFGALYRLFNLNWDQGFYLHPDERLYVNAAGITLPNNLRDFFNPNSPLNPHMFYYGSLPLFIYKFIYIIVGQFSSFLIISRFISALFSIATIPVIFLIGKIIFDKKVGLFAATIFTFSAGSIQYAHFNTTESILVFFLSLIILLSIKAYTEKRYIYFPLLGILLGLSYATKITGLTFGIIPLFTFVLLFKKSTARKIILSLIFFAATAILVGFLGSPYQIIDFQNFLKEQAYMQGVTYGQFKPPFVIIYENTLPYIYPLLKVLPFSFGFISLPLSLIGFLLLLKRAVKNKKIIYIFILFYPIFYFLWAGGWYAKFARYYILLFPFLSVFAGYALSEFKKLLALILLFLIMINGTLFLKIYLQENTRIQASEWIYKNITPNSSILGEYWDDTLPLPLKTSSNFKTGQVSLYDPDSPQKVVMLAHTLAQADYYIISSRRVYGSIQTNSLQYPYANNFYKVLFNGKLGYILVKRVTNYPFLISDDLADETFQSYDHPPVFIFKNEKKLSENEIASSIEK